MWVGVPACHKALAPFHMNFPINPTYTTWWDKFMCLLARSHLHSDPCHHHHQRPSLLGTASFKTGRAQNKKRWHSILWVMRRCTGRRAQKRSWTGFLELSSQASVVRDSGFPSPSYLKFSVTPTVSHFPREDGECPQHSLALLFD